MHYFEALSGLRFVMTTDPLVGRAGDALRALYRLYVDTWLRSPQYRPAVAVTSPAFAREADALMRSQPFFATEPPAPPR